MDRQINIFYWPIHSGETQLSIIREEELNGLITKANLLVKISAIVYCQGNTQYKQLCITLATLGKATEIDMIFIAKISK